MSAFDPLRTLGQSGSPQRMEATTAFETLAASLCGQPISCLWRGYGSAVFIELGDLTSTTNQDGSPGHPQGQVSLGVEWSWRVEDARAIICGSWSKEELWESSFARLRDARVERVKLFGGLPEIELSTEEGIRFLSFSTAEGQPKWKLVDRRADPALWFSVREGRLHLGNGSEPAQ